MKWEILPNGMLTEASLKRLYEEIEKTKVELEDIMKKPEMQSRLEKIMRIKSELKKK